MPLEPFHSEEKKCQTKELYIQLINASGS